MASCVSVNPQQIILSVSSIIAFIYRVRCIDDKDVDLYLRFHCY